MPRLRRCLYMRRLDRDQGFTLPELLIVIVIIGVISLPLGNLIIEYFRTTAQTQGRLHESHDAQITAAFFSQDVASIGRRDANGVLVQSVGTSPFTGVTACSTGLITPVLVLAWDQFDTPGGGATRIVVEYGTRTQIVGATAQIQLLRVHCTNSGNPDQTAVLAHDLTGPPSPNCTGSGATGCDDSSHVPATVTMQLSIHDPDDPNAAPYSIAVSGQRRQT